MKKIFVFGMLFAIFGAALGACSTPTPVQAPPSVEAAEITSYVTNSTDINGEADFPWVEMKGIYKTKFDNGMSLYIGYSSLLVHWLTWSDGGYYEIGTLEPGRDAGSLPITFFHPGEIAVIERDGKSFLYFKFVDGKVYMAKQEDG